MISVLLCGLKCLVIVKDVKSSDLKFSNNLEALGRRAKTKMASHNQPNTSFMFFNCCFHEGTTFLNEITTEHPSQNTYSAPYSHSHCTPQCGYVSLLRCCVPQLTCQEVHKGFHDQVWQCKSPADSRLAGAVFFFFFFHFLLGICRGSFLCFSSEDL